MSPIAKQHAVFTQKAPQAIGPYSQAIAWQELIFCSGQIPLDPATGAMVAETVVEQAHQAFKNLGAVLQAAHGDYDSVLNTTLYLLNFADFSMVNEIYQTYFPAPYPARATVEVSQLPKGALIEVSAIARKKN